MSAFRLPRQRDAWATIRGFTYQAVLTIERWLDLEAGQTLELERGEDIDLVARILDSEDQGETTRLLEQVKHLEDNVTLRSAAAVAAIANAFEHIKSNPKLALEFQFTTTAEIGTEQGDALQRARGIELWEHLRLGQVPTADEAAKVEMIRAQLRLASKPEDLPAKTWRLFRERLRRMSTAMLTKFIRRFRWTTGQPDLAVDWHPLQKRLIERGHAGSMEEAQSCCERLFAFVYKRLSTRGLKTLNPADLTEALRDPTLGALGLRKLRNLEEIQRVFEQRLNLAERAIAETRQEVTRYARQQDVLSDVVHSGQSVSLDVPLVASNIAARTDAVEALDALWQGTAWLALHGSISTGKTHLAVLLCQKHDCRAWICLEGKGGGEATGILTAALEALAGEPPPAMLGPWLDGLCEKLGAGTVIVLNDLPRLLDNNTLADRLARLVASAAKYGVRLLSTSTEPPAQSFVARLTSGMIVSTAVPEFGVQDTTELLRMKGAPPEVVQLAGPLCNLGRRHAALVSALVEHLRSVDWKLDDNWFRSVLEGEHSEVLDDETLARLTASIGDDDDRELLYRLSLLTGRFGDDEIRAVCAVLPALVHPAQRVRTLRGPWLQTETGGLLRASPLLAKLGTDNLTEQTRVDCCRELSRVITSRRILNQTELLSAFTYAVRGKVPERAAALLAIGLSALIKHETIRADNVLLSIWTDTPMPAEIPVGVRIHLRSLQIFTRHRAGLSVARLAADVRTLLSQLPPEESWPLVAAAVLTVPAMLATGIGAGFELLRDVIVRRDNLRLPDGSLVQTPGGFALEDLLWLPFEHRLTDETIAGWVTMFAGLPPDVRARALAGTMGAMGAQAVAMRPIIQELAQPAEERRWTAVAELFARLIPEAKAAGAELLWANLVRARLIVLGEQLGRAEDARVEAQTALDAASNDPTVRFLLQENVGCLLSRDPAHRPVGVEWLRRALSEDTPHYPDLRASAWINLSWALGDTNPQDAIIPAQRAVEISRVDTERTVPERVRALGEYAVALWLAGDLTGAAEVANEAGELLFSVREETENWKSLIVPLEILVGHLFIPLQTGRPMRPRADGTSPPAVRRSTFFSSPADYSRSYRPEFEARLHFQYSRLADLNGLPKRADQWRTQGLKLTHLEGSGEQITSLTIDDLSARLTQVGPGEVLIDAMAAAVAMEASSADGSVTNDQTDPAAILGTKPNDRWKKAEAYAAQHFFYATGLHLLRLAQHEPAHARSQAAEVARLCREQAPAMIDSDRWTKAAELFEQMSAEKVPAEKLHYFGERMINDHLELFALASLVASTAPELTMVTAFELQARAVRACELYLNIFPVAAVRSMLPFLHDYWWERFNRSRFGFRRPANVEQALQAARKVAPREQAKHLFHTILEGLSLVPSDKGTNDWLSVGK